jgi:group I intron endonuclease
MALIPYIVYFMIVYLITNLINGKKYVGQTSETLNRRWTKHQSNARRENQQAICRAIRKYNAKSFRVEVISECDSKQTMDTAEKHFIEKYNSNNPKFGYNLTGGGEGVIGWHHTEARKKISEASTGHSVSEKQRAQISAVHKGKTLSAETRAKISAFQLGKKRGPYSPERIAKATAGIRRYNELRRANQNHG